ncbi:MAG: FeoA family protein [Candidatus Omnitrophota bacterium]|jgi:Fe2+ transport system protein FeoA|nr:FeoA family protein [Candidatus Omnitrophota bacterium]
MKKVSLVHLKPNHKGKVLEILGGMGLQNRLMGMGIYVGKEIAKLSYIGLRGPVVIRVDRSVLALGHGMAAKIIVETE